jgi:copper(I)-binding protein
MRSYIFRLLPVICLLTSGFIQAADEAPAPRLNTEVELTGAYIHAPLPGKTTTVAYFTLHNRSAKPAVVTGVETDGAARAELHSHTHENGIMRMRKEDKISIPAHSSLAFAPGSWHVMLFDVQPGLKTGDELHLTVQFADGTALLAAARIKSLFDKAHH